MLPYDSDGACASTRDSTDAGIAVVVGNNRGLLSGKQMVVYARDDGIEHQPNLIAFIWFRASDACRIGGEAFILNGRQLRMSVCPSQDGD